MLTGKNKPIRVCVISKKFLKSMNINFDCAVVASYTEIFKIIA